MRMWEIRENEEYRNPYRKYREDNEDYSRGYKRGYQDALYEREGNYEYPRDKRY